MMKTEGMCEPKKRYWMKLVSFEAVAKLFPRERCMSVTFLPSRTAGLNDIVTIDLSPQCGNIWGDYARTIILENGVVVDRCKVSNEEWKNGLAMEDRLHHELVEFVSKETTFEELYYHINEIILKEGFVNLDFMGNLGHSIVKDKNERVYIEKGNTQKISDVEYFTFEPHISIPDSSYGYKKENIYYFQNGKLVEL